MVHRETQDWLDGRSWLGLAVVVECRRSGVIMQIAIPH